MAKRAPFLVDGDLDCMGFAAGVSDNDGDDCARPARIAVPGPSGSTWLFCIPCSMRWAELEMQTLIEALQNVDGANSLASHSAQARSR